MFAVAVEIRGKISSSAFVFISSVVFGFSQLDAPPEVESEPCVVVSVLIRCHYTEVLLMWQRGGGEEKHSVILLFGLGLSVNLCSWAVTFTNASQLPFPFLPVKPQVRQESEKEMELGFSFPAHCLGSDRIQVVAL